MAVDEPRESAANCRARWVLALAAVPLCSLGPSHAVTEHWLSVSYVSPIGDFKDSA